MSEREKHLEFIIDEIDAALCNYCNTVADADHPFHPLDEGAQKRTFKDLCDAYNLWYSRHPEISEISQREFQEHGRKVMALAQIADGRYPTIELAIAAAKEAFK